MIRLPKLTVGKVLVWSLVIIWTLSTIAHWIVMGNPLTPPPFDRTTWGLFTFAYEIIVGFILAIYLIYIIIDKWDTPIKLKFRK